MYFKDIGTPIESSYIKKEIEDLNEKIVYINALPTQQIRGIDFPFDTAGYYIVWPSSEYYKLRRWTSIDNSSKYYCPVGHQKPVYIISALKSTRNLLIVEGEINAISIGLLLPTFDIISPGGVGNFTDNQMISQLNKLEYYDTIIICVDNDAAGLQGALKLRHLLVKEDFSCEVIINLMEKDFNQLLTEYGNNFKEAVKKEFEDLGMSKWVSRE